MKLTIGIKALNEEAGIAKSLQSALNAALPFGGEVILADSGSADRTVEIAKGFPAKIVQLANPAERRCGAGAQLAFQHASGEYFYMLDGDMILEPTFMEQGIAFLEANPSYGGVGGRVTEMLTENDEFRLRALKTESEGHWSAGDVDRLDCGGLYRTSAVRQAGYFADRNLHAFEEFDLAARLACRGWKLARIDAPAVQHYGHTAPSYTLLMRRIRSGYTGATGEVLRGALGQPHLGVVLARLGHIRKGLVVIAWWALLALSALFLGWPALLLLAAPLPWFWWRTGSLSLVPYSFLVWNSTAWGLISGFFRQRIAPRTPLTSITIESLIQKRAE